MASLTTDYLTDKQIDIISIVSTFEILKPKIPNVFKISEDIDNFIAANQIDGISDYKICLHKFQTELNIFLIHTEDHSIKEILFKIMDTTSNIFELIKCIELEYHRCLDHNVDNMVKLCKIKKNSVDDEEMIKILFTQENTRYEANMFESANNNRIQIKELMIYIENYINKLNSGQSKHNFYN